MSTSDENSRLAALEQKVENLTQRLAGVEQMALLLAETEKNAITELQNLQQRAGSLEHNALARRIFDGLESASKMYRKKRTVIFVAREYFGDNTKYAFLAFCERAKASDLTCYLLVDDERQYRQCMAAGLACLPWQLHDWTAEHMKLLLEARVVVLNTIFSGYNEQRQLYRALLSGAKTVQMWHGLPLKTIGLENLHSPATLGESGADILGASGPFDVFVGTAANQHADWQRRFAFDHFAPTGYPRNDVLFRDLTPRDHINLDEKTYALAVTAVRNGKPIVLYAPTFRDERLGVWFHDAGIEKFAEHCRQRGYIFIVNMHPFELPWLTELQVRYPGINFIAGQTDIYPVLKHVSVFVTDYSSLVFDYLLLDRPVVFYRPDHETYIKNSRPLIEGHEGLVCGDLVQTVDSLMAAADKAVTALKQPDGDPYRALRQSLKQKLYDYSDGNSAARLSDMIKRLVDEA